MPLLNSTFPSTPPRSQNSFSKLCACTACLCGKAARASGSAKIDVVNIRPMPSLAFPKFSDSSKIRGPQLTKIHRQREPRPPFQPLHLLQLHEEQRR